MKYLKRLASLLIVIAIIFSFQSTVFADNPQSSDGIYEYSYGDKTIILSGELSEESTSKIINIFTGENKVVQTRNLICTIFGHNIETTSVDVVTHHVYPTYPYCKCDHYDVEVCTRCDYSNTTLVYTQRYGCCTE